MYFKRTMNLNDMCTFYDSRAELGSAPKHPILATNVREAAKKIVEMKISV